jgi:hypothetical protein
MIFKKFIKDSRAEIVKSSGGVLTLRLMGSSFGNPAKKDFYEEYFTKKTDFGDEFSKTRFSTYDHLPPPWAANPFSSRVLKTEPIGKAVLDETTEEGRWFLVELSKAKEYHEYFMELAKMGVLGASTQCLPGSKTMMPDGEITAWFETEIALTVQPADPDTLGRVNDMAKSFKIPLWADIKSALEEKAVEDALFQADADDRESKEADNEKDRQSPVVINTDKLVSDVKTSVKTSIEETLIGPLQAAENIVSDLHKAIGVLEIFMENEAFNKFIVEFAPTMAEHIRQMKASSYLLAKVNSGNGNGGSGRTSDASSMSKTADSGDKGSNGDGREDDGEDNGNVVHKASKLPSNAPGKR